ncbi:MAG: hypothetical protein PGN15_01125 [Aeromicrobium erythreum]
MAAWLLPVPLVLVVAIALALRHVPRTRTPRRAYPGFWGFSAARGATACVEVVLEWADVVVVGVLASPAEAGVYAVVTRCARAGEVVQQRRRIAVGPAISSASARGDTRARRTSVRRRHRRHGVGGLAVLRRAGGVRRAGALDLRP